MLPSEILNWARLGRVVNFSRAYTLKFVRFDYICGQPVAVHAAGVEPERVSSSTRFFRRPVAKQHHLFSVIFVVPRRAVALGAVGTKRAQLGQIIRGL